jgi:hypothetical protein
MKLKFTIGALALVGIAVFFACTGSQDLVSGYTPRNIETKNSSYYESLKFMKMLRGNLKTGEFENTDYLELQEVVNRYNANRADER